MMHDTTEALPVHPYTGLTALAVLPSGRIVWPVMGGDGTNDAPGNGDQGDQGNDQGDADSDDGDATSHDDNDGQGDADDTDADPEGADQLGDAGKKALDATKAKWKAERDKRREVERQLAEATAKKDGDGPDPAVAAEQAAMAKANSRIVRAEVRAAAAGKLADPKDALSFLDLDGFEVGDDGEVDADEIADAIADLIARKPYLAADAQPRKRFQGGGDGGQGRGSQAKSIDAQIREAEAKGDIATSVRLKQVKLAQAAKKSK
ncbi:hypothetical protein [Nocardiopsis synnemataformans]|uniref:hypothetical protein n=1 Tax=Nocardiopsis synnemataformans TaxID=61305 RepID=UPI003EB71C44